MEILKPLILELAKTIQSGKEIVNEQLPDLARQIVRLYLWGNVIEIPILIGLMVAGLYGAKWFEKKATKNEDSIGWRAGFIPIAIGEVIIGLYAYSCGQTLLTAILAPKLLIIKALFNLAK